MTTRNESQSCDDTMPATPLPGSNGPHGGVRVGLGNAAGTVEISIFEEGVPPRFRLYFYDVNSRPCDPPAASEVGLMTSRASGNEQLFAFVDAENFLESRIEIPEPHEFDVVLRIDRAGHQQTLRTRFTEEDHSHGAHGDHAVHSSHDHADAHADHGHGHDGGHAHGDGWWGRIQGIFGHSHDSSDKVDAALESNDRGIWALKISLVAMASTAVLQLIIVLFSGSVALLADTIHNFGDAVTSVPLWIAFALAKRGASRRFTYGYGKTEDVAGVLIVLVILFSACVAGYESISKIIHPQPMTHLGWVSVAAIIGFLGNEAVAVFRIRIGREIGSAALIADGQHARVDGFTSLAVLIGVGGVALGVPILDPIVGLLITIAILFIVKDAARAVWIRLIDGIEPEVLMQIEHAPVHVPGVIDVHDVRARWIGHRVHSDIVVTVRPDLSVAEGEVIAKGVEKAVLEHVRLLGSVVVRVSPAAPADAVA